MDANRPVDPRYGKSESGRAIFSGILAGLCRYRTTCHWSARANGPDPRACCRQRPDGPEPGRKPVLSQHRSSLQVPAYGEGSARSWARRYVDRRNLGQLGPPRREGRCHNARPRRRTSEERRDHDDGTGPSPSASPCSRIMRTRSRNMSVVVTIPTNSPLSTTGKQPSLRA